MSDGIPFLDRLGAELDRAELPRRDRKRLLPALALVIALAIVAFGLSNLRPEPASAGVDIRHRGGRVELRLVGRETDAATIEDAVHRNGLRLHVMAVAAGPSLVGHFLTFGSAAPPPEMRLLGSPDRVSYIGFSVPERWSSAVTIYVGRPARGNEIYQVAESAFGPGQPLECSGLFHAQGRRAAADLADRDLTVRWQAFAGNTPREVTIAEVRSGEVGRYLVADARAVSRHEVRIVLTADGTAPFPVQPTPPEPC